MGGRLIHLVIVGLGDFDGSVTLGYVVNIAMILLRNLLGH